MRRVLKSSNDREQLLVLLFCIAIAATFWVLSSLSQQYQYEVNAEISFENCPEDRIWTDDLNQDIVLSSRAQGWQLLNYMIGSNQKQFKIDLTKYQFRSSLEKSDLMRIAASQLPTGMTLIDVYPESIEMKLAKLGSKRVAVQAVLGEFESERFKISGEVKIQPDSITLIGSEADIAKIDRVYTESLDIADATESVRLPVQLVAQKLKGLKFSTEEVIVEVPIEAYTEKSIEVALKVANLPEGLELMTYPNMIKVTFSTPVSKYDEVSADDFRLTVNYEQIGGTEIRFLNVDLQSKPEFCLNFQVEPTEVEYIVYE